jgi:sec-independent protein translocase protein TatA
MFGSVGPTELIIALVIILLLFGAKRVPELAKGLGTGVREFRKGTRGEDESKEKQDEGKGEEALTSGEERDTVEQRDTVEERATVESDRAEQKQR